MMSDVQRRRKVKPVLNQGEKEAEKRLIRLSQRRGAFVRSKVRLADVFPIARSGLTDVHFDFALRSHFDFLIVDGKDHPLFAVELDGPSHDESKQIERDKKKDYIAKYFNFSLMRISRDDLERTESRIDRLTEIIELWFDRYEAENGHLAIVTNELPLSQNQKLQVRHVGARIQTSKEQGSATKPWGKEVVVTGVTLTVLMLGLFAFISIPAKETNSDLEKTRSRITDSRTWENDAATYRQMNFLEVLVLRQGWSEEERDAEIRQILGYRQSYLSLTKGEASQLITAWDGGGRAK